MTLEVSKLSGRLKASASCRAPRGASDTGKRACAGTKRCGTEGRAHQQRTQCERVWPSSGVGAEGDRWKRTRNMPFMYVTLEVSKLSDWLKASALCRVQKGASARQRDDARVARRCVAQRKGRMSSARVCGPVRECGGRRRRRKRTANMLLMSVTLEVSQLEMSALKLLKK
jgi:hypothetical protein